MSATGHDVPIVETHDLRKQIGGNQILRGLNLTLQQGQVVGLLGKNGAGKSTLLDVLLGFALPTSGKSLIFGTPSDRMSAATKARIGFVPQADELVGMMTGAQHLALTASFYDRWDNALIQRLAGDWQIPLQRRAASMSGGERQKLATLMALGHNPEFLVMDEPASGLDPVARRQFMQTVLDIARDSSRAILYSSHIVADIEKTATHIWVMRAGEMVWSGALPTLKASVVRVHLRSASAIDSKLTLPGQLDIVHNGKQAVATLRDFRPDELVNLSRLADAQIEVETLSLEEVFLALHA